MLPKAAVIPGIGGIAPVRQGDFDNLCGLCSILNAIHAATVSAGGELDRGDLRALFRHGVGLLARDRRLRSTLEAGIGEQGWYRLAVRMIEGAGAITGHPLRHRPLVPSDVRRLDSQQALRAIRREIAAGHPVLVILWGALNHCTVLVGYGASRFRLLDSSGHHWISIALTGLSHDRSRKRHQIAPASAMVVSAS